MHVRVSTDKTLRFIDTVVIIVYIGVRGCDRFFTSYAYGLGGGGGGRV